MRGGTCSTCMWWWDLNDTGVYKCYKRESRLFHETTDAERKCADHESLERARKDLRLGTYRKSKKEVRPGEA